MPKDDDQGGGFSGKRNKSWREIDAQRGKSKYHSRQDDPAQQRIERSASYSRYKLAADSLFKGGELPEGLAKTFDPDGKRKAQREAMLQLREMDRKSWVQGVLDYLEKYPELPEDPYFLDSLLDHPRERVGVADERRSARGVLGPKQALQVAVGGRNVDLCHGAGG